MSGVNVNSLPTKLDALEIVSSKANPISSKSKAKDEIIGSSNASTRSMRSDARDRAEKDSFSKELEGQERKISYGKPTEGRPTNVAKPTAAKDVETNANPTELNTVPVAHKKSAIVPSEDLTTVSGVQEPILKFLDSMERELGVEPEQVLAAFAAMSGDH